MNRKLTQPEEIEQVLKEIAEEEMKPLAGAMRKNWSGAYVSPYRAEYIKSHDLPNQAELSR
jgi:hypothetical protein